MIFRFQKDKEPKSLRTWLRHEPPATGFAQGTEPERGWNELPTEVKQTMRKQLHKDQRGLCCYCHVRIQDDHTSHLEHIKPQSADNRFDWENLALACEGGNLSKNPCHCDHAKGDQTLQLVHPYKAPVERFVRLGATKGQLKIRAGVDRTKWRHDIEQALGLNSSHLMRLRKAGLESVTAELDGDTRRRKSKDWRMQDLQRSLEQLEKRQRNNPMDYQPLIEDWLRVRLHRA